MSISRNAGSNSTQSTISMPRSSTTCSARRSPWPSRRVRLPHARAARRAGPPANAAREVGRVRVATPKSCSVAKFSATIASRARDRTAGVPWDARGTVEAGYPRADRADPCRVGGPCRQQARERAAARRSGASRRRTRSPRLGLLARRAGRRRPARSPARGGRYPGRAVRSASPPRGRARAGARASRSSENGRSTAFFSL